VFYNCKNGVTDLVIGAYRTIPSFPVLMDGSRNRTTRAFDGEEVGTALLDSICEP